MRKADTNVVTLLELRKLTEDQPKIVPSVLKHSMGRAFKIYACGFRTFLALIGNLNSIIILKEGIPESVCPSIDPKSISYYFD